MTDFSIDRFGFKAPSPRPRSDELAELWRQAVAATDNMPTCICHGFTLGMAGPDVIEKNILDTLHTRYRDAADKDLAAFVDKRRAKSPFAGLRPTFESWLRGIGGAPLSEQVRERLCDDLARALASFAEGAGEFVCD